MRYLDEASILEAYLLAEEAHEGHSRDGDAPYIQHPLQATHLMLDLKPDMEAILACLIHDVPLHKRDAFKIIEKKFGKEVVGLVHDASKLGMVQVRNYETQVESLRKLFMALARDLRVVFIRLADRLHNMLTLDQREEEYRLSMAQETMDVYAPIASRLGIHQFKSRLEDLAFKYINPEEYKFLLEEVQKYAEERQGAIDEATSDLENILREEGFDATVTGRAKHIHSIHNKLKKKGIPDIGAIYDVHALRVIVPDKEDFSHLYSVLGVIHSHWTPLPHRFKDYIAVPKPNGYRSLHTAIVWLIESRKKPVEIQIRTESMHEQAEYGVAAHWWYKENPRVSKKVAQSEFDKTLNQHKVFSKLNRILDQDPELRRKVEKLIKDWGIMDKEEIAEIEEELSRNGFGQDDMVILKNSRSKGMIMMRHKYFQDQLEWLEGMARLKTEAAKDVSERNLKLDIFKNRIFVLTPHGDVKDLPKGATPVDFAYVVHTDVGHTCAQAKVDGRIVPLDYELENGQVVEIMTRKEPKPNRYWLSFTRTAAAANKIKAWFRTSDRDHNLKEGREIMNKYLQRLGKPILDPKLTLLKSFGGKRLTQRDREEVVESVGNGSLTVGQVLRKLFSAEELVGKFKSSSYYLLYNQIISISNEKGSVCSVCLQR